MINLYSGKTCRSNVHRTRPHELAWSSTHPGLVSRGIKKTARLPSGLKEWNRVWSQALRVRAAPSSEVMAVRAEYRSARHRLAFCIINFEREPIPAQLECRYLSANLGVDRNNRKAPPRKVLASCTNEDWNFATQDKCSQALKTVLGCSLVMSVNESPRS